MATGVLVPVGAAGLDGRFGVPFGSMGRRYSEDPGSP
jgi:hypothetical protein